IEEEQVAKARYWKIPTCCDDDDDYDSAITPVLSTEETDNSLSMGDEHLDIILATESDELIKSNVENLVLIPSEFEGIPDTIDDDSLYNKNIEYVEASPHDSEVVSLEAVEIVILKVEEIKDDNLREKLLNVHLLIANIEALKDNPTPSSKLLTKSSSTSPKCFLEENNAFHNSFLKFENFYFDLGEISSGSTTTHSDISLSDYEAFSFNNDHIKESSSGSTTTHSYVSLSEYDSFVFDPSNDQFPSTDRRDFANEEFADELAHIISPPEYDCFYFWNLPDPGELMSIFNFRICGNLSTTSVNLPVEDDYSPLLTYVVWIFLAYLTYPVIPPYLHPFGNEDTIFDPGITINHFYSFKPGLPHWCGAFKKFNTHRSHLNEWPMIINGKNITILDVKDKQENDKIESKPDKNEKRVEEEDGGWICFLGGNNSLGTKKYRGSNSSDGGNTGDGVKITGGVIGSGDGIVDACKTAQDMWELIKRLMYASDVTNHVRHLQLMDEFDKFAAKEEKSLESVYKRLTMLVNIMDRNNVHPIPVSINTKFLNLQFEPHVQASKANRAAKNHDPLALIAHLNASLSQSHASSSYSHSPQPYYVTHPSSAVDYEEDYQGKLQGADDNAVTKPNYDAMAVSKTVSKVPNTKDTIKFKLDSQEIIYTMDMFRDTLHLPVETPDNPFISPVNIKEYETVFVGVEVPMNRPQLVVSTQRTHRTTPRDHWTPTLTAASPQGKKRKQKLDEEEIEKMVKGEEDEESYASRFSNSMLNDNDDSKNKIEPGSHKEYPEHVNDEDDETKKEKKDDTKDDKKDDDVKKRMMMLRRKTMMIILIIHCSYTYEPFACHDEHHTDVDPLEGRKRAKRVNLTALTLTFPGIEAHEPYSIVYKPNTCLIYLTNKYEKWVMFMVEIVKLCDATLERVLNEVKLRIFQNHFWKKPPRLGELDLDIMKAFEREITKHLRHRQQMRRWESFVNGRPIL
nr:hypothetical protein [Tanacetum cinerariifolium]